MSELTHKIRTSFICTIPSVVVTQALVQAGADTVVIDREHGAIGRENLHAMIASTAGTNCRPVVRVGKRDEAMVKLALDMGAAGIVFPQVNTAQEASDCVAMTRYSPRGRRGFGPFIGHSRWGVSFQEYLPKLGGTVLCNILSRQKRRSTTPRRSVLSRASVSWSSRHSIFRLSLAAPANSTIPFS